MVSPRSAPSTARVAAWITLVVGLAAPLTAGAQSSAAGAAKDASASVTLDRAVVRWYAPETGGVGRPQFIFARELAFGARIESFASPDPEPGIYQDRHIRAALDRHIAETLLASLPIMPTPSPMEVAARAEVARGILEQRAGSRSRLIEAAFAEGIGTDELDAILRRHARASLYLDRMVAPMLEPSEQELRAILRTQATPFKDLAYDQVAPALRRWFIGQRLGQALEAFYQGARSRVTVILIRGQ